MIKYNNTLNKSNIKLKHIKSIKEKEETPQRRGRIKKIKMKEKY